MVEHLLNENLSFRPSFDKRKKTTSATILDLDINILHKIFDISVHDKTNIFNLNVVKYPSLQSFVPDNILNNIRFQASKVIFKNLFFKDLIQKKTWQCTKTYLLNIPKAIFGV